MPVYSLCFTPDYLVHAQDDSNRWRSMTERRRNQCPETITTGAGWVSNLELDAYQGTPSAEAEEKHVPALLLLAFSIISRCGTARSQLMR